MIDLMKLQEAWARHETILEKNRKLNLELLRKVNLKSAKSKVNRLVWQNVATIIFYSLTALYFIKFTVDHWSVWYFVLSGFLITGWCLAIAYGAVKQLRLILSIDYSRPLTELQKTLAKIKLVVVKNLRLAGWALPFYWAFMIVFFEILSGTDIIEHADRAWLIRNGLLSIGFIGLAIFIHQKLNEENLDKKWINWLLQGSGSQLNEAQVFLKEIEDFERE